jgi:hypothetical protein
VFFLRNSAPASAGAFFSSMRMRALGASDSSRENKTLPCCIDRQTAYDPPAVQLCWGREFMKKVFGLVMLLVVVIPGVFAQEHYTEGPVWRVQLIRVKPTKMDAYLTSLRQSTKPFIDEQKKQGLITDYKVFLKQTKNSPEDWDICVAIQYKNWAALDGATAKGEAIRDKILGGKAQLQDLNDKRAEIREIISSELLQEIMLK